jgi:hypothetical protein
VKCLWGLELIFGPILIAIVLHVFLLAPICISACDSRVLNPVPRASSISIAM